nr:insulin-like androgenic gland hormone [Cancer borealis]
MSLPVIILLVLLTATQTKGNGSSFSVDCANVQRSMSYVCATFKLPSNDRKPRDTRLQDPATSDTTKSTFHPRPPHAIPMTPDEGLTLTPMLAYNLVKTQWSGGRFRRSQRSVNAYSECCDRPQGCTLQEVSEYCLTIKEPYRSILAQNNTHV